MNILAVIISFAYVFAVIGLAGLLKKVLNLSAEASRKTIHILLCNWVFVIYLFDNPWMASIAPACFIVINFISHKKNLIKSMEREDNDTYGTVFYAVTLLAAVWVAHFSEMRFVAVCGVLAMGYGDGLAALTGKYGKHKFPAAFSNKSWMGSVTVFAAVYTCVAITLAFNVTLPLALATALVCAVFAVFVELFSPKGTDNLTLPLSVMALVYVAAVFPHMALLLNTSLSITILLLAWALGSITIPALITAFLIATGIFITGGWGVYSALIAFFLLGNLASKIGKTKKLEAAKLHARSGKRSYVQVLANALPSLIFCAIYFCTNNTAYLIAAIACFAAATADTLSSEIGVLSKIPPINVLTFKPIQPGLSGGVSLLGFCGATIGAAVIAAISAFIGNIFTHSAILSIFIAGLFGSVIDSMLGAAFQAKYKTDNGLTEKPPNTKAKPSKGFAIVNNDMVNFISISLSGALALVMTLAT